MTIAIYILIAFALVVLNAFFVFAEYSLVRVRSTRLDELIKKKNKRAQKAKEVADKIERYLSTIQLGVTMTSLGLGWVGEPAFANLVKQIFPYLAPNLSTAVSYSISFAAGFAIITSLHIILGEQVPKLIAIRFPDKILLLTSIPLSIFYYLTYIPMRILNGSANFIIKMLGIEAERKEMLHSESELRMLLGQTQQEGKITLERLLMFENLFDFGHTVAKHIMTPRKDVAFLSLNKTWQENLEVIKQRRLSRYPLCEKSLDDAKSYVLLKDLAIDFMAENKLPNLESKKRKLLTIDENTPLEKALKLFQEKKLHQALVKDKDDKVTGLFTLEDILEELVGEIRDEIEKIPSSLLCVSFVKEAIDLDIHSTDRFKVLKHMAAKLHSVKPLFNKHKTMELLATREKMLSCALGHETAFPHVRIEELDKPLITFARSRRGVNFPAMDNKPVKLIFLILVPLSVPTYQLKILSQLSSLVSNETLKNRLLLAKTPDEVCQIITAFESRVALP
jgi:CBS domain containing-hemolysin-like protein/mannitol/fructose-specific phosphotransferase system IIA component (Ntr-type)